MDKPTKSDLIAAIHEANWRDTVILGETYIHDALHVVYTCQPRKHNDGSLRISIGGQYGVDGGEYRSSGITITENGEIMQDFDPSIDSLAAEALRMILLAPVKS